ncbi:putative DsrE/DsrF-like family protein [Candidatus Hydrogenisulfobacillus filiaventi]|uniref:Putative DsrE/DsrF-like family protein n=1 Tax=Candidatus Hydrogenisulfobacillus filiaventi TaxID=2707344 RepID=A0A6F8ZJG3_9FIRM|nr:putative DsrE/DsrF-like family protein [Candidatus Hydrogenisulfobacillus filiaventi]
MATEPITRPDTPTDIPVEEEPRPLKRVAIICRAGTYDTMVTVLGWAHALCFDAEEGTEVNVLFTAWAAELLKKGHLDQAVFPQDCAPRKEQFLQKVHEQRFTTPYDALKAAHATGRFHIYACAMAARLFDVTRDNLIPEAEIIGPVTFVREKANGADVVLTFG